MNKKEWVEIVSDVLEFNRLTTTAVERETEGYYIKCCNLVDEEYVREFKKNYGEWKDDPDYVPISLIGDDIADTLVVTIQLVEINTPSSLDWDCIELLRKSGLYTEYKDILVAPIAHVLDVGEELGLDVYAITKEICKSNMTKVPTLDSIMMYYGADQEPHEGSVDSACWSAADWIESQKDDGTEVIWKIVSDNYSIDRVVFYNKETMKVMKPWCFEEPKLGDFV